MIYFAFVVLIVSFVYLIKFVSSLNNLKRIESKLKALDPGGVSTPPLKQNIFKRIKELHARVNSDESAKLSSEADKIVPVYLLRFRIFLATMIIVSAIVFFID